MQKLVYSKIISIQLTKKKRTEQTNLDITKANIKQANKRDGPGTGRANAKEVEKIDGSNTGKQKQKKRIE